VKASHAFSAVSQSFDEPNLVSHGGLLTAAVLTERIGLWPLVAGALTVPGPTGVNSAAKTATVLAGMLSGADSFDDLDVLRAGGTRSSLDGRAGGLSTTAVALADRAGPELVLRAQPPDPPFADLVAGTFELIGQEPVAELWIVLVRVHEGVGEVGVLEVMIADG